MFSVIATTIKGGTVNLTTTDPIDSRNSKLIVLSVPFYGETNLPIIADNLGNTWTALTTRHSSPPANGASVRQYYCINPITGASHTFTNTGGVYATIWAGAFTAQGVITLGYEGGGGLNANNFIYPGATTPTKASSLLVGGVGTNPGSAHQVDSSFIGQFVNFSGGQYIGGGGAYKILSAASLQNPLFFWTGSALRAASLAVFVEEPVAAGGGKGGLYMGMGMGM